MSERAAVMVLVGATLLGASGCGASSGGSSDGSSGRSVAAFCKGLQQYSSLAQRTSSGDPEKAQAAQAAAARRAADAAPSDVRHEAEIWATAVQQIADTHEPDPLSSGTKGGEAAATLGKYLVDHCHVGGP